VPWKETCPMKQRMDFVLERRSGPMSMAALCRAFGVSRQTGYKWLARFYERKRFDDLADRSSRPHSHPATTDARVQARIVKARRQHPSWGPRKLRTWLKKWHPRLALPSPSTIGAILKRHGLVMPRRRARPHAPPRTQPFARCDAPNDVWCVDFKGDFLVGDGTRCWPLTIMDAYSRFLLCCRGFRRPDGKSVKRAFLDTFRRYGLPRAIRSDNGKPFCAVNAPAGLSQLAAWWVELGIKLERIDPGKPQQNGRHERMHRTLKYDAASPPARNLVAQQRAFDRFRRSYNLDRPHEAIGMVAPRERYRPSPRRLPRRVPSFDYALADRCFVRPDGKVRWGHRLVFLSQSLAGRVVGIEALDARYSEVRFGPVVLGVLDRDRPGVELIRRKEEMRGKKVSAM